MRKFFLSFAVILLFFFYVAYERGFLKGNNNNHQVVAPIPAQTSSQTYIPPVTTTTPIPAPAPKPLGLYKDGSYIGSVADAYYGNLQVKVIIANGKISDVQFLQYPSDRSTSVMINSQAMPYLKAEAIQAQSANVNIVSGATASSGAFQQSLASALAQAKN